MDSPLPGLELVLDTELSSPPTLVVYRTGVSEIFEVSLQMVSFRVDYPVEGNGQNEHRRKGEGCVRSLEASFMIRTDKRFLELIEKGLLFMKPTSIFPFSALEKEYEDHLKESLKELERLMVESGDQTSFSFGLRLHLSFSGTVGQEITKTARDCGLLEILENVPDYDLSMLSEDKRRKLSFSLSMFFSSIGEILKNKVSEKDLDFSYWFFSTSLLPCYISVRDLTGEVHPLLKRTDVLHGLFDVSFQPFGDKKYELDVLDWLLNWLEGCFSSLRDDEYHLDQTWFGTADAEGFFFRLSPLAKSEICSNMPPPPPIRGFHLTLESKLDVPYKLSKRYKEPSLVSLSVRQLAVFAENGVSLRRSDDVSGSGSLSAEVRECYESRFERNQSLLEGAGGGSKVHVVYLLLSSLNYLMSSSERYRVILKKNLSAGRLSMSLMDMILMGDRDRDWGNDLKILDKEGNLPVVEFSLYTARRIKDLSLRPFPGESGPPSKSDNQVAEVLDFFLSFIRDYLKWIKDERDFSCNCISTSGRSPEVGINFYFMKELRRETFDKMEEKESSFPRVGANLLFRP